MRFKVWLCVVWAIVFTQLGAQNMNVATFNLRYDSPHDAPDLWEVRAPHVAGLVQLYDFDIFGTQEGLVHQLNDLQAVLPGYRYIGVGRDDGARKGEYSAIFYKDEKFKLLDSGNFWLSAVIDKPNLGWDASNIRICTWGEFRIRGTGRSFFLFNVHFDHMGEVARNESVKLVLRQMAEIAGRSHAILTGDFNFDEGNENYRQVKASGYLLDTYDLAEMKYAPNATFNGFGKNINQAGRIDHVFVTRKIKVRRYGILTNTYNLRFPSDHFPVFTVIKL